MRVAVYPGSFDPVTNGHLDIIHRAARIYDRIIVGVLNNPKKKNPMFSVDERIDMLRQVTEDTDNVEVKSFEGLLVDFAKANGAEVIVKGLRTVADFEYEFQMALLNRALDQECETVFMMTDTKYSYISSSMVKELAGFRGDIAGLVPECIVDRIKGKINN